MQYRELLFGRCDFREKWNLKGEGDFLATFQGSLAVADSEYRPRYAGFTEINQAYGEAVNKVIIGVASAEEA